MEKVLDEDVEILRHVDPKHRVGAIATRYDITIKRFRKAVLDFQ